MYRHVSLFGHGKNEEGLYNDLLDKWNRYGTLYIGVDFDNTLLPYGRDSLWGDGDDSDDVGSGYFDIVSLLRWCKLLGMKLCLWSLCDGEEDLEWKLEWCREHMIEMDYVNESPLLREMSEGQRKVHFNVLLDDVAGLESVYSVLYNLCEVIDSIKIDEMKDGKEV